MDFSAHYFNKPLDQVTHGDLVTFFSTEKEETNIIEFKSIFEKQTPFNTIIEKSVIESICSFLNSDGGILILGSPIGEPRPANKKIKSFLGDLTPYPLEIDKDTIVRKVVDNIRPMPVGVKVQPIKCDEDGWVYIFEISESLSKPHQLENTKIYPIRLDGHNRAAPHYIIEAMMKQIKYPDIGGLIAFKILSVKDEYVDIELQIKFRNFSKTQNDEDFLFILYLGGTAKFIIDDHVAEDNNHYWDSGSSFRFESAWKVIHYGITYEHSSNIRINYTHLNLVKLFYGGRISQSKESTYTFMVLKNANPVIAFTQISEGKLNADILEDITSQTFYNSYK